MKNQSHKSVHREHDVNHVCHKMPLQCEPYNNIIIPMDTSPLKQKVEFFYDRELWHT